MHSNYRSITFFTCLTKVLAAVALALAYHARFTETVSTGTQDEEGRIASESDDELALGEVSETSKPTRNYSVRVVGKRLRRFLRYAFPFKSRLAVCITGRSSVNLLTPRYN